MCTIILILSYVHNLVIILNPIHQPISRLREAVTVFSPLAWYRQVALSGIDRDPVSQ